ncbi:CPBP family intramembrane glutamic endopeptidase [Sphingopyxis sp. FD7]|jgi:membrane protease YdiL (CAAX protease family)|uniref:CPBP family intramembrane glutamic endopeptidase n=1 Tax=Sphingopyxis sp. FD7 TaxID=1914525 RepID=UPI000DC63ED3|nr:CPBP family intramembrane glutamic endopeptidase [Sphingopyxis sp. FD7]BBB12784.1 CAAX amino terminal protease family protein [Sphingopyxis sp. FD7]
MTGTAPPAAGTAPRAPIASNDIAVFLVLTAIFTAIAYIPLLAIDPGVSARRHYILLLMWSPGVAALLTCRICGIGLATLGWRWPRGRWMAWGYGLPLLYAAAAYAVLWLGGFALFAPPEALDALATSFGWQGAHPAALIAGTLLIKATAGFIVAASSALGEEIGWRGFLAPRLAGQVGARGGALILGGIWTLWHVPLLIAGGYNNGVEPGFALGCFTVLVFAGSIVAMWLRLGSDSLWPCVAWHASHNLFIQSVFGALVGEKAGVTPYWAGEFGVLAPLALVVVAVPAYRALARIDRG